MNATVAWITARGLLGRARVLLLIPLPLLLIGLALICSAAGINATDWGQPVLIGLGIVVVLPVIALIVGSGVLGSEIDDGTLVHILTKPLPRSQIVLTKLMVAVVITALTTAAPLFVAALFAGSARLGLALAAGAAVGALGYSALFLLLSLVTNRPVLLGLVYVLVWEGLLGRFVSGTRVLSIQQYVLTLADKIDPTGVVTSKVSLPVAVVMTVVITIAATVYAVHRLRSFSVAGETS